MEVGGFGTCSGCREYRWLDGTGPSLCVECHARVERERRERPAPEDDGAVAPHERGRAAKDVRKKVERKYEKGKLGVKPRREQVAELARRLWDDLEPGEKEWLTTDLRDLGFTQPEPFDALVDLCEATVRKARTAKKTAKTTDGA